MYYKYWMDWFSILLVKFFLSAAVTIISVAIFMAGINGHAFLGVVFGIGLNIVALIVIVSFAKAAAIPWKGASEEFIPFYTKKWESYKDYKKRIEKENGLAK